MTERIGVKVIRNTALTDDEKLEQLQYCSDEYTGCDGCPVLKERRRRRTNDCDLRVVFNSAR